MTDSFARQVHELLSRAMEVETERRREFLQEACRETPELAARVEQLIAAVTDSHAFLEEPALRALGEEVWTFESALPKFVGNYEIIKKLGSGGMGNVFEAVQRQPHRTVALKIPRIQRWSQNKRAQMLYESELLGQLRHANIAQVYESGLDDSVPEHPMPFIAMEYVPDALTIRDYVREQRLGLHEILRMFRMVCEAIQHAHRLGIIHRDLKPANILVDGDGNPKVIDFGVASTQGLAESVIKTNPAGSQGSPALAGTLNYMSPEQCDSSTVLDVRTDVYSLGVVLFELVCKSLPYDLKGMSVPEAVQAIQSLPPRSIDDQVRMIPWDVQAILKKALEKERHHRYSSAEALSDDIGRFLESRPISARQATVGYVAGRLINRNRWLASAVGLLALAIFTGTVASILFAWQASVEIGKRRLAEYETRNQLDESIWQSYIANMHGAFAAFQNQEVALVRSRLTAAPDKHRNWEWDYLNGIVEIDEQTVRAHEGMIFSFAVSHDKTRWATGSNDGVIRIWSRENGSLVPYRSFPSSITQDATSDSDAVIELAFRNGTSQILSGTNSGHIRIWNIHSGELVEEFQGHQAPITSISVRPDGMIASTCTKKQLRIWDGTQTQPINAVCDEQKDFSGVQYCDQGRSMITWDGQGTIWLRDGETRQIIQRYRYGNGLRRVSASADGKWIAAGGRDNRLQLWQTDVSDTRGQTLQIPGRRSSTDSLCFSDDNSRLAIGRIDRQIAQYSLENLTYLGQLQGHEEYVRGLTYDPSCKRLISASGDGTLRVWDLESEGRGNVKTPPQDDVSFKSLSISPDGETIAVAGSDRSIGLYDRQLKLLQKLPIEHVGEIYAVAWSPLGKTLATAGQDRNIRIWDCETGESTAFKPLHTKGISSLAYSPDGKWLVSAGADSVLRVWDLENRSQACELAGHERTVMCLRFSNDSRWLASGSIDGTTILWDWKSKKVAHRLVGHWSNVFALAFDPDSSRLFSGSRDRTIRVWSTENGKSLGVLAGHGQLIRSLDIHPDGTRLVAGSWFGDIQFWDLSKLELVATFKGHSDVVYDLKFSPNGDYFASCSLDKTIQKFERRSKAKERRRAE
jgi:WD40 repeat protein